MSKLMNHLSALAGAFGRQVDALFSFDAIDWDWATSDSVPAGADCDLSS